MTKFSSFGSSEVLMLFNLVLEGPLSISLTKSPRSSSTTKAGVFPPSSWTKFWVRCIVFRLGGSLSPKVPSSFDPKTHLASPSRIVARHLFLPRSLSRIHIFGMHDEEPDFENWDKSESETVGQRVKKNQIRRGRTASLRSLILVRLSNPHEWSNPWISTVSKFTNSVFNFEQRHFEKRGSTSDVSTARRVKKDEASLLSSFLPTSHTNSTFSANLYQNVLFNRQVFHQQVITSSHSSFSFLNLFFSHGWPNSPICNWQSSLCCHSRLWKDNDSKGKGWIGCECNLWSKRWFFCCYLPF